MQWTFRSSIAMKQMEKKERKVRDLLILNVIVVVPNHNPNDDIECMKKPSISEQQQRYYSNVHVVLKIPLYDQFFFLF